jgi:glycosyltransferase involved in cell wall biosynthesis
MRLGFDASSLRARGKGLARAQQQLLLAMARLERVPELTVFAPPEATIPDVPGWLRVDVPPGSMLRWEQWRLPRAARQLGLDVLLTTSERAALWGPPQVVYIYEHPRHRARLAAATGARARQRLVDATTLLLFRLSMRHAAVVLAVSHATARDLAPLTPAGVVHSAAGDVFRPGGSPEDYFLHLASDDPRDNTEAVIDALALLARRGSRPRLVIPGGIRERLAPLQERARRAGVTEQIEWTGFVSDEQLADLYRRAWAYVDPSLFEGFGLQALEALSCGTPTIAADSTSLPEVVGDAGILVPPHDVEALAEAMARVLDPALRAELSRRALEQAAAFSWERTARELLDACAALAAGPPPAAAGAS